MLKILVERFKQGCRTIPFPQGPLPVLPLRYRGRPIIAGVGGRVDVGALTFVPDDGIAYSSDFRMAVTERSHLVAGNEEYHLAGMLKDEVRKIFGRSLKLRQVSAGGCNACEADINVLNTPAFDLSRFGIQFVASPRHADGIVVTGPVTQNMKEALLMTYEAVPDPKIVIALGACAISGGIFAGSPACSRGLDAILPVDLYIPGCPPHPLTTLDGLLRLLGRIKARVAAAFVVMFLFSSFSVAYAQATPQRGLFVSVIEKPLVLSSREGINKLLEFAAKADIKDLFVQVYRANQSWFPSKVSDQGPYLKAFKSVGADPFALLISKAHARGIKVHAWVNLLSLSKNLNAPILKKFGRSILTRNVKPKETLEDYAIDQQYFLEPGDLSVRKELADMVGEIVTAYPTLDGIQFDYIRYPDKDPAYGHTRTNMARYKKASGVRTIEESADSWKNWKRAQVTELLEKLVNRARGIHPDIHVSTTGCMSWSRAYHEAFQDWPLWINSGLVEFVTVMSYPNNVDDFKANLADAQKRTTHPEKIYVGVGAYKFVKDPDPFIKMFDLCEKTDHGACVVFYYGSLLENPALKKSFYSAPNPK